uniref:S-methyl-5'-thioadenosine phosphorylase n=1 Tax=Ascaris suum TaxID=6253 RepID=F1L8K5_ASCSU
MFAVVSWIANSPWIRYISGSDKSSRTSSKMVFKIGIIGGTGLEDPKIFENAREITVDTPYGEPSDCLLEGQVGGITCVLLSRHGRKHDKSPSKVNFRANLWALMKQGVSVILATATSGSLKEELTPGSLVFLDSIIDRTFKREVTFHDGLPGHPKGVCHIPMHPAYNEKLRQILISCAEDLKYKYFKTGTAVCIEGPRYSSRAESAVFRSWNADIVNMTVCPEVYLAKELGIPYASTALITDYDCWRDAKDDEHVSVELVDKRMKENCDKAKNLFLAAIKKIGAEKWDDEIRNAKAIARSSVMIDKDEVIEHLKF